MKTSPAFAPALVLLACGLWPHAAAAQVFAEELRIEGFWPDASLSVGGGIGLDHSLDTNVFGKLRLGALYAYEPWVVSLGVVGELGALPKRGLGAELELNHFGGFWLQAGASRVLDDEWMGHATLGYTVFGVEWQHRFSDRRNDALVFVLRAPIGIIWFLIHDDAARTRRQKHRERSESEPEQR